jgi:hypothetical protein
MYMQHGGVLPQNSGRNVDIYMLPGFSVRVALPRAIKILVQIHV